MAVSIDLVSLLPSICNGCLCIRCNGEVPCDRLGDGNDVSGSHSFRAPEARNLNNGLIDFFHALLFFLPRVSNSCGLPIIQDIFF